MNTPVLELPDRLRLQFVTSSLAKDVKPTFFKKDNGNLVVQRMPVFRSGQFTDSIGVRHNFENLHVDQMVANYKLLTGRSIIQSVPVRDGHPGFLNKGTPGAGQVIGWHTELSAETRNSEIDGNPYHFLFADFELTEPEAQAKLERGTFRNRSAEIGEYVTNDEATFWPCYMGFAFVDFSAVEGLNSFSKTKSDGSKFIVMFEKGMPTVDPVTPPVPTPPVAPPAAPPVAPTPMQVTFGQQVLSDQDAIQTAVNALFTQNNELSVKVTAHEAAEKERGEKTRKDFVSKLIADNKLMASKQADTEAFALSLSPEQFTQWSGTQTDAPVVPALQVFDQHQNLAPTVVGGPSNPQEEKISQLEQILLSHMRTGSDVKEFESYRELKQLAPNSPVLARVK